jgi:hypothetical protein
MSAPLIQVTVALTKGAAINTPTGAQSAGTSVVVTDANGAQPAVVLTGTETPTPWSFPTSVATGSVSVTATDLDSTGATLGTPVTATFTEAAPPTFQPTTAITLTQGVAPTASVRSAALRK